MATKNETVTESVDEKMIPAPAATVEDAPAKEADPEPVPFVEPRVTRPAPTAQQRNWLSNHPAYVQMGQHLMTRFSNRGTLHADGTFVDETVHPPMDGHGCMSVGVPISRAR